jgi:hypothetical protein
LRDSSAASITSESGRLRRRARAMAWRYILGSRVISTRTIIGSSPRVGSRCETAPRVRSTTDRLFAHYTLHVPDPRGRQPFAPENAPFCASPLPSIRANFLENAVLTKFTESSRHSHGPFSTMPHPPKPRHVGQTLIPEDRPTPPALCPATICSTPTQGTRPREDSLLLTYR